AVIGALAGCGGDKRQPRRQQVLHRDARGRVRPVVGEGDGEGDGVAHVWCGGGGRLSAGEVGGAGGGGGGEAVVWRGCGGRGGSGSNWSAWLTLAVFAPGPGLTTVAAMVRVCVAPAATVPMVQSRVAGSKEPAVAEDDWKLTPAGSTSSTVTLVAASGPLLVRV